MNNAILLGIGLIDNTAKDLSRISKNLRASGRNLASIGSELTMGVTLPIVAAGGALLKFAGDLDGMKKALAANMGGMAQANVEFEKLRDLAKAPGIGLEEAIKGSYRLQGLGESAAEARYQMANFAKVVSLSGGGEAQFGGLLQQFTQMKGVGKILGGDIRFMIENAPVLGKVLNDAFGTANPEKLRDMGITVDQLIAGMMAQMDKLKGIGGSVKNTLENLWTSIRIGAGEIGLAILGATGFGDTLNSLSDNIDKSVRSATKWIKENEGMVKSIGKLLVAMAVTGPLVRFGGNLYMIAGLLIGMPGHILKIISALVKIDTASKLMSLTTFGWIGVAAAAVWALVEAAEALDRFAFKDKDGKRIIKTAEDGRKYTQALGQRGRYYIPDPISPEAKQSARDLLGSLDIGTRTRKNMWNDVPKKSGSVVKPKAPPTDEELKAAQDAYAAKIKLQREMEQMFRESPVKSRLESVPAQRGFEELANKKITPTKVPFEQSDTKVLKEYAAALRDIKMEQKMGLAPLEAMKMGVDAAADSYRSMVGLYGEASSQAAEAFGVWKNASDALTTATEEHNKQLEKQSTLMEYVSTAVNGVADALTSLVTDGSKGMENFGKSILKLATNLLKMAIAQFISSAVSSLGIFSPPVAIAGAAALGASAAGLIGKISLAGGGLLTGESMIRAGEYPGVQADPEVISPVSKIQKYIREAVGNGGGNLHAVISGDDIHLVTSKAQGRAQRRGSGNVITF